MATRVKDNADKNTFYRLDITSRVDGKQSQKRQPSNVISFKSSYGSASPEGTRITYLRGNTANMADDGV